MVEAGWYLVRNINYSKYEFLFVARSRCSSPEGTWDGAYKYRPLGGQWDRSWDETWWDEAALEEAERIKPTKAQLLSYMKWLVKEATNGTR